MYDRFDLERFVVAQDRADTYVTALAELRAGRKRTHWMWYVFPQVAGLGYSPTSRAYAISCLGEAREYLAHPVLGARLHECAAALTTVFGLSAADIFGELDAEKLGSSMTLFHRAAPQDLIFQRVLEQYFGGATDPATDQLLARS
jgi:uncharacterized protein (DUF1810 family)